MALFVRCVSWRREEVQRLRREVEAAVGIASQSWLIDVSSRVAAASSLKRLAVQCEAAGQRHAAMMLVEAPFLWGWSGDLTLDTVHWLGASPDSPRRCARCHVVPVSTATRPCV
jgi:hypothetical protein